MEDPDKNPDKKPRKRAQKKASPKKRASKKKAPKKKETTSYDASFNSLSSLNSLLKSIPEPPSIKRKRMSMKMVSGTLQEHMDNFILVGYTMDGDPVQMMFAPTPKDIDSLSTNLQKFIMDSGHTGL